MYICIYICIYKVGIFPPHLMSFFFALLPTAQITRSPKMWSRRNEIKITSSDVNAPLI